MRILFPLLLKKKKDKEKEHRVKDDETSNEKKERTSKFEMVCECSMMKSRISSFFEQHYRYIEKAKFVKKSTYYA